MHWCLTQTQIMLARDRTGRKRFLVWESEENEFETLFQVLLKRAWNWLRTGHKGTIHLLLTDSYFFLIEKKKTTWNCIPRYLKYLMISNSNHFTLGIFFNHLLLAASNPRQSNVIGFLREGGIQLMYESKKSEQIGRGVCISVTFGNTCRLRSQAKFLFVPWRIQFRTQATANLLFPVTTTEVLLKLRENHFRRSRKDWAVGKPMWRHHIQHGGLGDCTENPQMP